MATWVVGAMLAMTTACTVAQVGAAKAQEVAQEFNLNARFGRMELATESVDPKARAEFLQRRARWGGDIRLADIELAGLRSLDKDHQDVEVSVRVAWYRPAEGELKNTLLLQRWHSFKGDYRLTEESHLDGDRGLLGEQVQAVAPSAHDLQPAHFPTIRLKGDDPQR